MADVDGDLIAHQALVHGRYHVLRSITSLVQERDCQSVAIYVGTRVYVVGTVLGDKDVLPARLGDEGLCGVS